jgi:hypothetical protein
VNQENGDYLSGFPRRVEGEGYVNPFIYLFIFMILLEFKIAE